MAELGAIFLRPDRKDRAALRRPRRHPPSVESIIDTIKGQLLLERHGAHTMPGLTTRAAQRLLALAAALWHNWKIGEPGRCHGAAKESNLPSGGLLRRNRF